MAVLPVFTRLDMYVYKDKSDTDNAQVPAAGVTVRFFPQAATASAAGDFNYGSAAANLAVYNVGGIKSGDTVWVNGGSAKELIVTVAPDPVNNLITLQRTQTGNVHVSQFDRVTSVTAEIDVYRDPVGAVVIASPRQTNASGFFGGYPRAYRYDRIVYVSATDIRIFPDCVGSYVMR